MNISDWQNKVMGAINGMIERGAPDKYDGVGFNKMSHNAIYKIMQKPRYKMSDWERLIHHLIRHEKQVESLGYDIDELKDIQQQILSFPVDIEFNPETNVLELGLPYNDSYIEQLRMIKDAVYLDGYNYVPIGSVIQCVRGLEPLLPGIAKAVGDVLKQHGWTGRRIKEEYADQMTDAHKYYHVRQQVNVAKDAPLSVVLNYNGEHDMIEVFMSRYDADMVAALKALPREARGYDKDTRQWSVTPAYHTMLLENISKTTATYVDNTLDFVKDVPQTGKVDLDAITSAIDTAEALELIIKDYSVIYDKKQYQHQLEGEAFMLTVGSCINADDMGLGKTNMGIISAHIQRGRHNNSPVLVLVPATLKPNWLREIFMWLQKDAGVVQIVANDRTRSFIYADNKEKFVELKIKESEAEKLGLSHRGIRQTTKADWVIVNYDLLASLHDDLLEWRKRCGNVIVIADEAHYLKNETSARTKAVLGYSKNDKAGTKRIKVPGIVEGATVRYALTGTPNTGKNRDILPLAQFIEHPLAKNKKYFLNRYCDPQTNRFGTTFDGSTNAEELYSLMATHMIQRRKQDVLDLPGKTRQYRYVDIDLNAYWAAWDEYMETYHDRTGKDFNHQVEHLTERSVLRRVASEMKIPITTEFARQLVDEGSGKVIVFTNYTATADALEKEFSGSCIKIVGGMNDKSRDNAVQAFQNDPQIRVAIVNYKSGGVGITLTAANSVIMADLDWLPTTHTQAEDRSNRIGQNMKVTIYYLIANGTHEEAVKEAVDERARIIEVMENKNYEIASDWRETFNMFLRDMPRLREREGYAKKSNKRRAV